MSKFKYDDCCGGSGLICFWLCDDGKTIIMLCDRCNTVFDPVSGDTILLSDKKETYWSIPSEFICKNKKGRLQVYNLYRIGKKRSCWANYVRVLCYGWGKYVGKEALIHYETYLKIHDEK